MDLNFNVLFIAAFTFLDAQFEILLIGVGGGNLPSFISKTFKQVRTGLQDLKTKKGVMK